MPIQTLLVGARPMFRAGLASVLASSGFEVIATVDNAEAAIRAAPKDPGLAVLDTVRCPMQAVNEVALLHAGFSEIRIALIAEPDQLDYAHIVAAFHAGMNAYLINPSAEVFIKSMELVMLGETILPREILLTAPKREHEAGTISALSNRETEILRHLAKGCTNKQIARLCQAAEATVKVHVKAIARKLRVKNRTQAATWAMGNLPTINGAKIAAVLKDEIKVGEEVTR